MINLSAIMPSLHNLSRVAALKNGWHFGVGLSPTVAARMNAAALTLIASNAGASKFEYFPEESGGILIIAYRGPESAEILASGNGGFELAFEDALGFSPSKIIASMDEIQAHLEQRGWRSKKSYGSYTRLLTVSKKDDTRQSRFDPPEAEFPLSTRIVLRAVDSPAAPMPRNTIRRKSGGLPQSSGASRFRNLLQTAS